jgi:hypothetical protein
MSLENTFIQRYFTEMQLIGRDRFVSVRQVLKIVTSQSCITFCHADRPVSATFIQFRRLCGNIAALTLRHISQTIITDNFDFAASLSCSVVCHAPPLPEQCTFRNQLCIFLFEMFLLLFLLPALNSPISSLFLPLPHFGRFFKDEFSFRESAR